ncbi:IS200/IS605 family transposase [Floridanema aerugineum]|uniref:Transposase n=1 Tax=Floridaenema aerugineum BLCC-F46 TaxID=3153654 RepID=A0ABV4X8H2_9CYAN
MLWYNILHILIKPNHPTKLVNSLKTVSSRLIRKEFAEHINKFYSLPVFWTGAYCVISAGGAPLEIFKTYILAPRRT